MGYPDELVMHVSEPMRATIESLANRRKREILKLTNEYLMEDSELLLYNDELRVVEQIITKCQQCGT